MMFVDAEECKVIFHLSIWVMNTAVFQFLSNEAKKLTFWAFNLSKRMMLTCLKAQFNAAVLPVYFVYGGIKYIYQSYHTDEVDQTLEPSSEVIVTAVRNLRGSVLSGMHGISSSRRDTETNSSMASNSSSVNEQSDSHDSTDHSLGESTTVRSTINSEAKFLGVNEFSGGDLLWDVPVIWKKSQYFEDCLKEKETRITAARTALEDHPIKSRMPKTRLEYAKILAEARNGLDCSIVPVAENGDDSQSTNTTDSVTSEIITSDLNVEGNGEQNQVLGENGASSQRRKTKYNCNRFSTQGMAIRHNVSRLHTTLGKIQTACNEVMEKLADLNDNLNKVIQMREKLTELEFKAKEVTDLYEESEEHRSILMNKISDLEKLICEEEQHFSDLSSIESGYYESENARNSVQH